LHDSIKVESWGICAVPVATHEFMSAARAQAAALGRADFDAVYVRHPVAGSDAGGNGREG